MKVQKYFFLASLTLIMSLYGCKNTESTSIASTKSTEDHNSLLWKIEGNGLPQPSYLYGTIHMIGAKDFNMGATLQKTIENADVIVMELDMDNLNQLEMMTMAMMPENKTVEDLLSPEDYILLRNFLLDSLKVSVLEFNIYKKMKPVLLSQLFAQQYIDGVPIAFELEFMKIAKANNIAIEGLESVKQQMAFIDSIPLEKQAEMLMEGVHESVESKLAFEKMIRYYKMQDLDSLDHLLNYEYPEYMEYQDVLLNNRNKSWIAPLEEYIRENSAFIAVGAGHLLGDNGLINLLREKGYTVTPVETD